MLSELRASLERNWSLSKVMKPCIVSTPAVGPGIADILRYMVDGLAWVPMKGAASCDKPRVDACSLRSEDTRMGLPNSFGCCSVRSGNLLNRNILLRGGREIN
jgi:hypothetical protein